MRKQELIIRDANKLLINIEDETLSRVTESLAASFTALEQEMKARWTFADDKSLLPSDRAMLLLQQISASLNVLDPKSAQTKALKKRLRTLNKEARAIGANTADTLLTSIDQDFNLASTAQLNLEAIADAADRGYKRLLHHGEDFSNRVNAVVNFGIAQGHGFKRVSSMMAAQLGITSSKAETLVRTESMLAYDQANRGRYVENDIEYTEHISTLDSRVCPYCAARSGNKYSAGYSPILHPNCRCVATPWKEEWEELGLAPLSDARAHRKEAIAKLKAAGGKPNYGPGPFEKLAGLSKAPKPFRNALTTKPLPGTAPPKPEPAKRAPAQYRDPKFLKQEIAILAPEGKDATYYNGKSTGLTLKRAGLLAELGTIDPGREYKLTKDQFNRLERIEVNSFDREARRVKIYESERLEMFSSNGYISWTVDGEYTSGDVSAPVSKADLRHMASTWDDFLKSKAGDRTFSNDPISSDGQFNSRVRAYEKKGFWSFEGGHTQIMDNRSDKSKPFEENGKTYRTRKDGVLVWVNAGKEIEGTQSTKKQKKPVAPVSRADDTARIEGTQINPSLNTEARLLEAAQRLSLSPEDINRLPSYSSIVFDMQDFQEDFDAALRSMLDDF